MSGAHLSDNRKLQLHERNSKRQKALLTFAAT